MISKKEQFKNLVKAGAGVIRNLKFVEAGFGAITEDEFDLPDEAYDIYHAIDFTPFLLIANTVAGIANSEGVAPDVVRILFADAASLFVAKNKLADEYLELVCSIIFAGNGWEELDELEKQLDKSELHYIRNNY